MADFHIRVATNPDVQAIVSLANQYTFQNLPEQDRHLGFLTGVFSEAAVQTMVNSARSIVAYHHNDLAGFVINTQLSPSEYPPLVQEIIQTLPNLHFQNLPVNEYQYFFYGPVLVATPYRNQGLLRQMFLKTTEELKPDFNLAIAFIDQANIVSYQIHTQHLGFFAISTITFNNRSYSILGVSLG